MNTPSKKTFATTAILAALALSSSGAFAAGRNDRDQRADHRPPQVSQVTPSQGERMNERGRTFIHARVQDDRSGVDPRSIRLVVDGLDVTGDARITRDAVDYRERLGRGNHRAQLVVRDRAGNVNRTAWTFRVV
jgi:hypothetical protein